MLRLRKILLCNYLYYSILIVIILLTIIRLNIKDKIYYKEGYNEIIGYISKISKKDNNITYEIKAKEKLLATTSNNYKVSIGDKVEIKGLITTPTSPKTKYLFNYQDYLSRKHIHHIIRIDKFKVIKENSNVFYKLKEFLNNYISNRYLKTFILGDKSNIKKEVLNSYQSNGISHLFAISGMHITLLSSILDKILKKIFTEEKRYKTISLFLIIYLFLVGFSPSILRGVLFYLIFTGNNIYYFYIKKENLFIIVLSIALLINPNYIYDIGFKYSYTISYALLKMSNYLESNNKIVSLLKVSILSLLVSSPITLKNYYQLNILSIIYNIVYVPFISIILFPFTLLVFIFKPLEPIYNILITVLEESSLLLSNISIGKILFIRLPDIIYILYFILILIYLITKNKKVLIIYLILISIHFIYPYIVNTNYLKIIDVGQGDSTLIHLNHKNIMIDTGGITSREGVIFNNILNPILKINGINKTDYLILTHGDYDHMGEAITLVNNYKVDKVIFNCGEYNYLEKELIKVLNKKRIKYYSCIDELNIKNNKLYFLQTNIYDNENDNSNVIYFELSNYKYLFMGDAGINKEKDLLNEYNISNIDILKVGHHGSKTSSSKEFIDVINPKYSIISVGENNKFGHPNKEVLNNLSNTIILRTDIDGTITINNKRNGITIER